MEDELERNMTTLFSVNEKINEKINESNKLNDVDLLYLCIFLNEGIDKYIITQNTELVNSLAKKKKNLQIYIFKNNPTDDIYNFYSKYLNKY
jgi:hypothetical protein